MSEPGETVLVENVSRKLFVYTAAGYLNAEETEDGMAFSMVNNCGIVCAEHPEYARRKAVEMFKGHWPDAQILFTNIVELSSFDIAKLLTQIAL